MSDPDSRREPAELAAELAAQSALFAVNYQLATEPADVRAAWMRLTKAFSALHARIEEHTHD